MQFLVPLLALVLLAWPVLYPKYKAWQDRRRFALDIAHVRLIQGPRLVCSEWEGDKTVFERAQTLKALIALSGNTWITADDIVVRVYHPDRGDGKTFLSFEVWRAMVLQEFAGICARHHAKITGLGNAAFDAAVHGQSANLNTF